MEASKNNEPLLDNIKDGHEEICEYCGEDTVVQSQQEHQSICSGQWVEAYCISCTSEPIVFSLGTESAWIRQYVREHCCTEEDCLGFIAIDNVFVSHNIIKERVSTCKN
jgi:hypothetical protein